MCPPRLIIKKRLHVFIEYTSFVWCRHCTRREQEYAVDGQVAASGACLGIGGTSSGVSRAPRGEVTSVSDSGPFDVLSARVLGFV